MIRLNDFGAQWREVGDAVLTATDRVGKSGQYILGAEVVTLEKRLAIFWGRLHSVGCASGLDALEICLRALGLRPGQKVLTTPLSAFATTLAIIRAGGVPVFVDVDGSGLIDLDQAEEAFDTDQELRFFVPVHLYGNAINLERLAKLRDRFNIKIIEDCAQAIGASWCNIPVGSVGSMAATSFYPTKNLGCMGDGGAVFTDDEDLARLAKSLRNYGQSSKYVHEYLGLNSRLDELQAAIINEAFLPHIERTTARRRAIAQMYSSHITTPSLTLPTVSIDSNSVWHLYPLLVKKERQRFQDFLALHNVDTGFHYPKLIPEQTALLGKSFFVIGDLPNARLFTETQISIPIHPYLTDDEVSYVIDTCNRWCD